MTENIGDRAQDVGARRPRVSDCDNIDVIISGMNPGEMKTNDQLIAEQLRTDPEFRAEWERTVLARAVAVAIVRYRSEHDLSQRELGQRLGMKQPQVARLELGEVNPSIETLIRISAQLGIEFVITVHPTGAPRSTARLSLDKPSASRSPRPEVAELKVSASYPHSARPGRQTGRPLARVLSIRS